MSIIPTIEFVGAYPVIISEDERQIALGFSDDAAEVEKELSSLALVELEISYVPSNWSLMFFKQDHTEFVPYDETYYDAVSLKRLSCHRPNQDRFRVAFYLHFFDPDLPLSTPYGLVDCRKLQPLPPHLNEKSYMYWK